MYRKAFPPLSLIALLLLLCAPAHAMDADQCGRVKFSIDDLPFFGSPDSRPAEERPEKKANVRPREEYTYDAMGRKVPVRTDSEGSSSHIR